jgi:hypothetical protein
LENGLRGPEKIKEDHGRYCSPLQPADGDMVKMVVIEKSEWIQEIHRKENLRNW